MPERSQPSSAFEKAVYRRVTWRLIPFLFLCYIFAYIDRVNVGFAKLQMQQDLGMSDTVYGTGAGIFFLGYFFFEIPCNMALQKIGAKYWLGPIMIVWGVVSGCTMFVKLWQFDPADRAQLRLDTGTMAPRDAKGRDGVRLVALFKDAREDVRLEQWEADAAIELEPEGGLEVLVLAGGFREQGETFAPQSWVRLPVGARFSARAGSEGCRVWIKEGHLRHVQAPEG